MNTVITYPLVYFCLFLNVNLFSQEVSINIPTSGERRIFTGSTQMSQGKALFIYDFADSEPYYLDGVTNWDSNHLNRKLTVEGILVQFIDGKSVIKDWKIIEAFTLIEKLDEKILGHWVATSTQDSLLAIEDLIISGKQIIFEKRKYEDKAYEWGGGAYNGSSFKKIRVFHF